MIFLEGITNCILKGQNGNINLFFWYKSSIDKTLNKVLAIFIGCPNNIKIILERSNWRTIHFTLQNIDFCKRKILYHPFFFKFIIFYESSTRRPVALYPELFLGTWVPDRLHLRRLVHAFSQRSTCPISVQVKRMMLFELTDKR